MAKIITEEFRVGNTEEFYQSFEDRYENVLTNFQDGLEDYNANNALGLSNTNVEEIVAILDDSLSADLPATEYYIFASSRDSENTITNTQFEKRDFLRRTIFGNRLSVNDVRYLLRKRNWLSGTIYDNFDDQEDFSESDTYVTVLEGNEGEGPYRVYKCIDNNYDSPSTSIPTGTDLEEFQLEDGYTWKFMFEVPASLYLLYETTQSIPYAAYQDVIDNAKQGISDILIESYTVGLFSDYLLGECSLSSVVEDENVANNYVMRIVTEQTPKTNLDFYQGMYVYFSNGGDAFIGEILNSEVPSSVSEPNVLEITINTDFAVSSLVGQTCFFYPKINVSRGSVTNCVAYGNLDSSGTIDDIYFYERGEGYEYATASVNFPPDLVSTEEENLLRVIVAPKGGHGFDPIRELNMSRAVIVTNFISDPLYNTPTSGTYTKIGLVKNPLFETGSYPDTFDNRMKLATTGGFDTNIVKVGSIVSQTVNGEVVTGIIHEVNGSDIYLVDYIGAFQGQIQTGSATVKISADSETSVEVTINTITINEINGQNQNYIAYSGELLHFIDFDAIERVDGGREKVKLIFDF